MSSGDLPTQQSDSQTNDIPVHRISPLPKAVARGRLIVPGTVMHDTAYALTQFCGEDGRHEGIAFWAGRLCGDDCVVVACIVPDASHGRQHVSVDESSFGDAARAARSFGLGLVAQVHSHPGRDTRHSSGDDRLIIMPREGMFSIVVGDYGRGPMEAGAGLGVHQYQDGQWAQIIDTTACILVVPTTVKT